MLEPQSTILFLLLIAAFGALVAAMLAVRQVVFSVLAACLAFLLAVTFGVAAVNKYYDYYQTWGAAAADLSPGSGVPAGLPAAPPVSGRAARHGATAAAYLRASRQGYTLRLRVAGRRSHLTRAVYAYLPPQYFQPRYRRYRFPVIELIHGHPGEPQDWINVVGVTGIFDRLLQEGLAMPAVLVMPDANGGRRVSLQCLNQAGGPQDLTYLAVDLPGELPRILRVQPPGRAWAVAGYSEGGFCAANMALRYPHRYGYAGVLSGYFLPGRNQLASPLRRVSPFGGDQALRAENSPLEEVRRLPAGAAIPKFWLGVGTASQQDVTDVRRFWAALRLRQADIPLELTPGGGHTMATWRAEIPPMLTWMTPGLARAARRSRAARTVSARGPLAGARRPGPGGP